MATFWQDVRYAARTLMNMRGAAALAVLILAIGIGATTTMFSVVYAALLRPLPFDEPDRIVMLHLTRTSARAREDRLRFSHPELAALEAQATSFEVAASFSRTSLAIELPEPEQIDGEVVSAHYFDLLRVAPLTGRHFTEEEDSQPGAHPLVIVSARMWRGRMASDPNVLSRTLPVNGVPLSIIGVMPDGFNGLSGRADLWIPTAMAPRLTYADYLTTPQHFLPAVARLKAGVSLEAANAELAAIGPRAVAVDTTETDPTAVWGARAIPVGEARVDPAVRRSALLLFAGIGCVLLIACANVASLMMARLRQRRREVALRSALGAGTWRMVRQLLTESLVLAAAGGLLGHADRRLGRAARCRHRAQRVALVGHRLRADSGICRAGGGWRRAAVCAHRHAPDERDLRRGAGRRRRADGSAERAERRSADDGERAVECAGRDCGRGNRDRRAARDRREPVRHELRADAAVAGRLRDGQRPDVPHRPAGVALPGRRGPSDRRAAAHEHPARAGRGARRGQPVHAVQQRLRAHDAALSRAKRPTPGPRR